MNKTDIQYIGRLVNEGELEGNQRPVFVNRSRCIQFRIKSLTLPDTDDLTVFGFNNIIMDDIYEDDEYAEQDERIQKFYDYCRGSLFIFTYKVKDEFRNIIKARTVPVPSGYNDRMEFYPVPVFANKDDQDIKAWEVEKRWNLFRDFSTIDEFTDSIRSGRSVGSVYGYDIDSAAPSFAVWREKDGRLFAVGNISSTRVDPSGSYVLCGGDIFVEDISEYMEQIVYPDDFNPCLMFIPEEIYNRITDLLHSDAVKRDQERKAEAERQAGMEALSEENPEETSVMEEKEIPSETDLPESEDGLEGIDTDRKDDRLVIDMMEYHSQKNNLFYDKKDLVNFHTAVKCTNLVILSGISGTGKSSLVDIYARALGVETGTLDSRLLFVPVRPSWNDDGDLLGYVDLVHMVYHASDSGFVDFLVRSQTEENKDKLFFVCFDEMNLARVEHYFSQFLSILERPAGQRKLKLYDRQYEGRLYNSKDYPYQIDIGDNVRFIGTVNIDETTYNFSDKVLDRANVIDLEISDFSRQWSHKNYKATRTPVWSLSDFEKIIIKTPVRDMSEIRSMLWDIHCMLQRASRKYGVGPRIVKSIELYLSNLPSDMELSQKFGFRDAVDIQVAQRVLTKVRGPENMIGDVLRADNEDNFTAIFDKYEGLSDFRLCREIVDQKRKETETYGYCI